MNTEQQSTAELIEKPAEAAESIAVPAEWEKDFKSINDLLVTMESWKAMTIEKDGITKVTANRVAAKKLRIRIEELRKELGRVIMLRKSNVDAFADKLKVAVTAVEDALGVIEDAHKAKVKAEKEKREAEAAIVLNQRIEALWRYQYTPTDVAAIGKMTPPEFLALLDARRCIFETAKETKRRRERIQEIGPDANDFDVSIMTDAEFETYLNCHRVACEVAERERAEAEQAERDRVEKIERELEESRQRVAELEAATIADRRRQLSEVSDSQISDDMLLIMSDDSFRDLLAIAVERKDSEAQKTSGRLVDTENLPPDIGEVIDAEFEVIQPGGELLVPLGYDVQAVADTVDISLNMRIDDSELYRIGNELNLSADAFRMLMHLGDSSISAVFRIEKKTGVGTLIRVNGLDVDRPF